MIKSVCHSLCALRKSFPWWGLLAVIGLSGCTTVPPGAQNPVRYDWGPLAGAWEDVHGNQRQRMLGPVVDRTQTPEGWEANAVRPVFHRYAHPEREVVRGEVLWPVGAYRSREQSSYTRFLLAYRWNWDRSDPESRHRFWLFPFVFTGRTATGEDYFAVFPLFGTIREFFFWDRIRFVLFPLYVNSRIQDNEAHTFLWPFISKTEGPGLRRFRIFPLYGYNEREGLGRKTFVLWPFYTQVRYTVPGASGFGWILFPVTGHLKMQNQETWWMVPPIFRLTKSEEETKILGPWPFFQKEKGEDRDKTYFWPLYGRKVVDGVDRRFFVWPLGHYEVSEDVDGITTRKGFFPFYREYHTVPSEEMGDEAVEENWIKVWPFFSRLRQADGRNQTIVIPDLNPLRGGPIERNYAPFWHLYVRQQVKDQVDTEVLWGLYRSHARAESYRYRSLFPLISWSRSEEGGHFSLLKGLLSRRNEAGKKRWRVLYLFQFGDKG